VRAALLQALLCAVLLLPASVEAGEVDAADWLTRAEQAFAQRRFRDVLGALQEVPEQHALAGRARFLRAYAHYQLGELDQADALLTRLDASAEVSLLRGMVAYGQGRFDQADRLLRQVIDSGQQPWSSTATKLADRVRADAKRAQDHRFAALLKRARAALEGMRLDEARRALDEAEQIKPGQLMPSYYRGLLAYRQMRYKRAEQHLRRALEIDPRDGWSEYMLALTLSESGDPPAARVALARLCEQASDNQLRLRARQALHLLEGPGEQRRSGPLVTLELGTGLDTNPAYIDERPAELDEASLELHAAARGAYQFWLSRSFKGIVGASIFERAYAKGGERFEQTEISGWATLSLVRERFNAGLSYSYALFMYGHSPLSSSHGGHLTFNLAVRSWLWLVSAARVVARPVHDEVYSYLPWLDAGGAVGLRLIGSWLTAELSYDLSRSWADTILTDHLETIGKGKNATTLKVRITSDYSQLSHGPYLWARARLPWRLFGLAGVGLVQRAFDSPGLRVSARESSTIGPRNDLMLTAQAELARRFPAGFEIALRFESVDNFSNLTLDEWGQDRTYSRRLAGLLVRWNWPPQ